MKKTLVLIASSILAQTVVAAPLSSCSSHFRELGTWIKSKIYGARPLKQFEEDFAPSENDVRFVEEFLNTIQIGYDPDYMTTMIEHRWHGMWSRYENLWDLKYSDSPSNFGLNDMFFSVPDPGKNKYRIFAKRALHRMRDPEPLAYIVGWERPDYFYADWAIHVIWVSGGDYWMFGKTFGGSKKVWLKSRPQ